MSYDVKSLRVVSRYDHCISTTKPMLVRSRDRQDRRSVGVAIYMYVTDAASSGEFAIQTNRSTPADAPVGQYRNFRGFIAGAFYHHPKPV